MIRNVHWQNSNESRRYPVDDAASGADSRGALLPSNIVSDLKLHWPRHLANWAFLGAVTVTPYAVTVTIQGAQASDSVDDFTPLAVLTVPKPVTVGRVYALQSQASGVGGWISFGLGANGPDYSGRFSGPAASRLTARAARPYRELPVASLSVLHAATALTGLITLRATEPLVFSKEEREVHGALRDCIVLRLTDSPVADGLTVPVSSQASAPDRISVFQQFAGPCAGRPESQTCGDPQPIEAINGIVPDCNGELTVEFLGCASIAQISDRCGIVVDCGLGLIDACLPPQLPDFAGFLPSEVPPANLPHTPEVVPEPDIPVSESYVVLPELPYLNLFDGPDTAHLVTQLGAWEWIADDHPSPVYLDSYSESISVSGESTGTPGSFRTRVTATRNIATWQPPDDIAVFRKATTETILEAGATGDRHNAQLLVNYRLDELFTNRYVYFAAEIDYDQQRVLIGHWNGSTFHVLTSTAVPSLLLDTWYKLALTIQAETAGTTRLIATCRSTESLAVDVQLETVVTDYQPSHGAFGLGSDLALARFAYLLIEAAP